MNIGIGIIGSGNMGASMGVIWAAKGHKVLFSFCKDQEKLGATAAAAGPNACTDTPAGAVAFGELVLLSVPWTAVPEALKAAGAFQGKSFLGHRLVNITRPKGTKDETRSDCSRTRELSSLCRQGSCSDRSADRGRLPFHQPARQPD